MALINMKFNIWLGVEILKKYRECDKIQEYVPRNGCSVLHGVNSQIKNKYMRWYNVIYSSHFYSLFYEYIHLGQNQSLTHLLRSKPMIKTPLMF